jgi:hypothetical protein
MPESRQNLRRTMQSLSNPQDAVGSAPVVLTKCPTNDRHLSFSPRRSGKDLDAIADIEVAAASAAFGSDLGSGAAPGKMVGSSFWEKFAGSLQVLCVEEVKQALLGHSCMVAPGAITLLNNLLVSADVDEVKLEVSEMAHIMLGIQVQGL